MDDVPQHCQWKPDQIVQLGHGGTYFARRGSQWYVVAALSLRNDVIGSRETTWEQIVAEYGGVPPTVYPQ